MRILIAIVSDILIAVISLFAASEIFGLKRYSSFTVPYTDKLISLGIIEADKRESILREDRSSHVIGIGIAVLVCVLMARFLAWPTGLIVFAVVLAASLIFTHPDMTETEATRDAYFRAHKASIHTQRYVAFIQSLKEDAQPPRDDAPGTGE